jgi:hypothetical protein
LYPLFFLAFLVFGTSAGEGAVQQKGLRNDNYSLQTPGPMAVEEIFVEQRPRQPDTRKVPKEIFT